MEESVNIFMFQVRKDSKCAKMLSLIVGQGGFSKLHLKELKFPLPGMYYLPNLIAQIFGLRVPKKKVSYVLICLHFFADKAILTFFFIFNLKMRLRFFRVFHVMKVSFLRLQT